MRPRRVARSTARHRGEEIPRGDDNGPVEGSRGGSHHVHVLGEVSAELGAPVRAYIPRSPGDERGVHVARLGAPLLVEGLLRRWRLRASLTRITTTRQG